MSVRFKFKNDLDFQPIPCDGFHISVRDLKRSIIRLKKFGKITDFDLVVTNSQTLHVYLDDEELISKNTTLTVQRAPLGEGKKKVWTLDSSSASLSSSSSHYYAQPHRHPNIIHISIINVFIIIFPLSTLQLL